jgi:dipeptide/tripeptide permease
VKQNYEVINTFQKCNPFIKQLIFFLSLITAIEFSERLSYFGIATSLVIYLTKVMHQDLKTAVRNVNYWSGVTTLMPLFGGFLADSYLGRYTTVIGSCIIYLMVINLNHSI